MTDLDRQASCPSCGAPITFKFAGARALVCAYCKFVVARSGAGLVATGRMAELLEIATPLQLDTQGQWNGEPFIVAGRVQMDRAGAPGAPWQEILVDFPMSGKQSWIAYAQGRWYVTDELPALPEGLPAFDSLGPGNHLSLGSHGQYVVQEVGQRRVISGEGSMTGVPAPGVITRYADISGPNGAYGTIDYGDGSAAPTLYLGRQFQPSEMTLESGMPLEAPTAAVTTVECPNCGGNLPLVSEQSERMICQYCGTASDITKGTLAALGPAPKPTQPPYIPLGSQGNLRGLSCIVCGFVIRSCVVEGTTYFWREYLLFAGQEAGYRWLIEEDGHWLHVDPLEVGELTDSGQQVMYLGQSYAFKQQTHAKVDYVLGEFYWKVEIGETVQATDFESPSGNKISREVTSTELTYSYATPLDSGELTAFGVAEPARPMGALSLDGDHEGGGQLAKVIIWVVIVVLFLIFSAMNECSSGGGYYGGSRGGGWRGGK